jgi:dihydroorotate dehydrogenase
VVSVGGAMTPQDVFDRLEMGANLVEVYSALVFEGPSFFNKVAEVASRQWPN